jgi:hypothetical protein
MNNYNSGITVRKGTEVAGGSGIGILLAEFIIAIGDKVAPEFFADADIKTAITSLAIVVCAVASRMINNWLSHRKDSDETNS